MTAVYNEIDPAAANALRELIANNLIAPGDVDERSIKDVRTDDYRGYTQVHCFAGAGLWSGALRAAGWPDERPVGSGSCPCQGFSLAGKGLGFDDPRHLFPDWLRLIDEAREQGQPWTETLFIEQVASAGQWLDLVQLGLEDRGYAFDATDLPAAGFSQGTHIRQRFYGVADRHNAERWADVAGRHFGDWSQAGRIESYGQPGADQSLSGVADRAGGIGSDRQLQRSWQHGQQPQDSGAMRMADGGDAQQLRRRQFSRGGTRPRDAERQVERLEGLCSPGWLGHHHYSGSPQRPLTVDERGAVRVEGPAVGASGSLLGCDWLFCHDGKIRPVESGAFPLAPTSPGRLGALRIFGNGLDFETAVNFVSAFLEAESMAEALT